MNRGALAVGIAASLSISLVLAMGAAEMYGGAEPEMTRGTPEPESTQTPHVITVEVTARATEPRSFWTPTPTPFGAEMSPDDHLIGHNTPTPMYSHYGY